MPSRQTNPVKSCGMNAPLPVHWRLSEAFEMLIGWHNCFQFIPKQVQVSHLPLYKRIRFELRTD